MRSSLVAMNLLSIWWRHQMGTFSALLALCEGNSHVTAEFRSQRPATRSCDIFLDRRLNKRLSKSSTRWWFETPSRSLWRQCNENRWLNDEMKIGACSSFGDRGDIARFSVTTAHVTVHTMGTTGPRFFRLYTHHLVAMRGAICGCSRGELTILNILTHWGRDEIDAISQTTFANAFSWMKMYWFRVKFHWNYFPRAN